MMLFTQFFCVLLLITSTMFANAQTDASSFSSSSKNQNPPKTSTIRNSSVTTVDVSPKVTLNFKEMDINLLIETISEVTKRTFIVDPRVKANVTVVSPVPMNGEEVYQVFLSILSTYGFTAIETGKTVKIVPDTFAKSDNTPVLNNNNQLTGSQIITQVVKVKNVSAAQLVPLLRPLIPQQGHLVAYPNNNTLVISDTADNVNRLLKIIDRMDLADDKEIEVMVLQYANASEVMRIISTLEQQNNAAVAAAGGGIQTSIVADDRTNSLLISGDKTARLRLRALISHLDTPIKSNTGNTKVIYLRYAEAVKLAEILRGVGESSSALQKNTSSASANTTALVPTTPSNGTNGNQNTVQTPRMSNNSGSNGGESNLFKAYIQADETTNSLIITAEPENMQAIEGVIRQLDVRRAQVLVEAVIAEISTDTTQELGVQWILGGSSNSVMPLGASNFNNAGTSIINLATAAYQVDQTGSLSNLPSIGAGSFLGLGRFSNSGFNFGMLLRALASDTNANILSTPSLLTLDNQEAEIKVGQNVPFITGQYSSTGTSTGTATPFQTIEREDVGIKLKVTPQINEGNAIRLEIEQEVSGLTYSSIATADVVINKRTIKTTVIVEDGNTIVLGGLIDEDLKQNSQKVPLLGDIPLLGRLFRSDSSQKTKRNLMVFLHPSIVRDGETNRNISEGKYNYMRAKQLEQQQQGVPLLDKNLVPVLPALNEFMTTLPGHQPLLPANINDPLPNLR